MTQKQRGMVVSVACDLDGRLTQLKSDLLSEVNPQKRLELRGEIHEFEQMIEKLDGALK